MPIIKFLPGDGQEYYCNVEYFAGGFPRDVDDTCSFCNGDPCAEKQLPRNLLDASPIQLYALYKLDQGEYFDTCPVCEGKPT